MQRQGSQANMAGGVQGFNNDENKNHDIVYQALSLTNEIDLTDLLSRKDILNELIAQLSNKNKDDQVVIEGKKL